jgi:hypothetical protein
VVTKVDVFCAGVVVVVDGKLDGSLMIGGVIDRSRGRRGRDWKKLKDEPAKQIASLAACVA